MYVFNANHFQRGAQISVWLVCFWLQSLSPFAKAQEIWDTIIDSPPRILGDGHSIRSYTRINVLEGGSVGFNFEAGHVGLENKNIWVNVGGGRVGDSFAAYHGTTVDISRGTIGNGLTLYPGSKLRFRGGSIGDGIEALTGSQVSIHGGDFRLDGEPIEGFLEFGEHQRFELPEGALLSGVLSDGTPFAATSFELDTFAPDVLDLVYVPIPPGESAVFVATEKQVPNGIRATQTAIADRGGAIGNHFVAGRGSRLIVEEGGQVGQNLEAIGASVSIRGGTVGNTFAAFLGAEVDVSAGQIGNVLTAFAGSQVRVRGGSVGNGFSVFDGGQATIEAGQIGDTFVARDGSQINIAGGEFLGRIFALEGSHLSFLGTEFQIDGIPISGLELGETVTIDDRGGFFTATLADGSTFDRILNSRFVSSSDYFPFSTTIDITLVSNLTGDFDSNGTVDQGDLDLVLLNWGETIGSPVATGWVNDLPFGKIDQQELDRILLNWGNSVDLRLGNAVPEPDAWLIIVTATGLLLGSVGKRVKHNLSSTAGIVECIPWMHPMRIMPLKFFAVFSKHVRMRRHSCSQPKVA